MNLTKVTCTGADDSVNPLDILALAEKYRFAEFGVLLSRSAGDGGMPRFPSQEWLDRLSGFTITRGVNLSAHICGGWVREIMLGEWGILDSHGASAMISEARRIQLNFHASPHAIDDQFTHGLGHDLFENKQFIFQHDNVNNRFLDIATRAGINAVPLFDLSHGAGVLAESWPSADPFDHGCGYAGGLSPENVAEQLYKIEKVCGEKEIWIDAETKLRSNNDKQFDLAKVEAFLKAARPFVREDPR